MADTRVHPSKHLPRATYRLQLRQGMDLTRAAQLVPYLSRLGVSHLYLSPVFQAVPGSTHGYDVVRPDQIDSTLGGRAAFDRLTDSLRGHDMGLILDIVPNHMAAHWTNPWWADVLERGQGSRYANYFNISWERGEGKVILPFLGAPLPEILERGELQIVPEGGEGPGFGPHLRYHEHRFPLAGSSSAPPNLPRGAAGSAELHELLEQQNYRLVHFRESEQINYVRFFDISSLVSLRIEEPEVFAAIHRLPLELIDSGAVQGLRVDHVDGLRDPEAYLHHLQEAAGAASRGNPPYVIVEKILERDEELPPSWPVSGTTGYEFLNAANALLVSPTGLRALEDFYREMTGDRRSFDEVLYESKREILSTLFHGEVRALVELI
ncbi:MAG TPA: alpha-amylase family glycosyl hydrolase, partial [Thermoleophilia bacterium]|nr:alpha-amylase family glycosyl hydrolase [Thermoleophilia bacterium]